MATKHNPDFLAAQMAITKPDRVLFVPRQVEGESDNVHLYVIEHEKFGGFLAFWTQSTVEHTGNNHLVMATSKDGGKTWSLPKFLLGANPQSTDYGQGEAQASWGFPVVSKSGRIYLFYYREIPGYVDVSRQLSATLAGVYSDDCGESWSESGDLMQRITPYDCRGDIQDNIVYQLPMRGPDGKYLAGFTKYVSRKIEPKLRGGCRVYFYRFENLDDDPPVKDLKITVLPEDENGIFVCQPNGACGNIEEPAWVKLPDGRIFCVMRTSLGSVFYAISSDCGVHWTKPEPLRFSDSAPFVHPNSPCPLYDLGDGRYLQFYHGAFDAQNTYFPRNPVRCAIGHFDKAERQPLCFDKRADKLFMELDESADSLGYGKELALYSSMTHFGSEHILWYPDRKFFLLGKRVR